ncbi:MAG TPA: lysylphosphatidylglycerol synthase domain-containing protein, partial [Aggregatilineales bacterium]|nr:lysylphosphatidylglycerol synthase domain-containing protein [Aggregatilineales bacterium]
MKRWHTVLIGLIISAGFLYLSLRQADFGQIIGAFRTARYGYVVLGLAGVVVTVLVRGLRWSVLTQGRLTVTDGFWLFNVGFLFNNVLPA